MRGAERSRAIALVRGPAVFLGLGMVWELLSTFHVVSPLLLPRLTQILSVLGSRDVAPELALNLAATTGKALMGFILAAFVGAAVGLSVARSEWLSAVAEPVLEFLRPMPAAAVIPVALLFLGLGLKMEVFVVFFGSVWPVLVSAVEGGRSVDERLREAAQLMRLSRSQIFFLVELPSAGPFIASGLRTSLAVSLILTVTAEMIAGSSGLGFFILDRERAFRITEMYAGLILLGVTGAVLNKIFLRLQDAVLYWKRRSTEFPEIA